MEHWKLNDRTVTMPYHIPRINKLLDQMAWGNFHITIDLCKGYWQIPSYAEAVPKSFCIPPFSLYQSRVMLFGMKNALATFQRMVDRLLGGLQDFRCDYLEDIAIYSSSWEEHLGHLDQVLDVLGNKG